MASSKRDNGNRSAVNSPTQEALARAFSSGAMVSLDIQKADGFWRPEPGEKLAGRLERFSQWEDDDGPRGTYYIRTAFPVRCSVYDEDTEEYTDEELPPESIIGVDDKAGLRALRDYVAKQALVQIEYVGKEEFQTKKGQKRSFHRFKIEGEHAKKVPWSDKPDARSSAEDDIPF